MKKYSKMRNANQDNLFKPKSLKWDSLVMLSGITRSNLTINEQEISVLEELFWNDICSEYDADNLSKFLNNSDLNFSPEFKVFEKVWRRDERNHYVGFRQIYSLLYNEPVEQIERRLADREKDFSSINEFLQDEFMICMVLAYDEIATTRAYRMDFELYKSFGQQSIADWIKYVAHDEALHFSNILEVIKRCHSERLAEVPVVIDQLVEYDLADNDYKATFVLDHKGYYFTPKFLCDCGKIIYNLLDKRINYKYEKPINIDI